MPKLITALFLAAFALTGCGGDDDSLTPGVIPPPVSGPGAAPVISKIDVITNNPQIPSDGGIPATITAFIKDASNNFVDGVVVSFAASSGGIVVTQGTTDANGVATATVSTAGDPSNRIITITATAGTLSETIDVAVSGSQLTISGPTSLVQGDSANYTIVLVDGAGTGISGETVEVSSMRGNTLEASSLTTDTSGQAQVRLTATQGGSDTLTATGLGLQATRVLTVSDDSFAFKSPGANSEVDLGAIQVVTVEWLQNGVAQVGRTINFSTTRGEFVGIVGVPQVVTNGAGQASISVTSDNAGPAIVSADAVGGPTTQLTLEFIATLPAFIEVQASPFTIAPNNQATVTAVVRDAANNRVKNARVSFSLQDITGGTLSVGAAETDSQGRAQTFYTASDVLSGNLGVTVSAFIEADPSIIDSVSLTVARRELFVAIGTGNELIETDDLTSYEIPYLVIVTDSEGNGVPGASVQLDIRSIKYSKGIWILPDSDDPWFPDVRVTCLDEDINGNGILDTDEIDENNNGSIEAGNVVEIINGDQITDDEGKFIATLRYAKVYGIWTTVRLRAQVTVAGTEFAEDLEFLLEVTANDLERDNAPPGLLKPPDPAELGFDAIFRSSPWGYGDLCAEDF